jgi:DivIVA domain-containing protein
MPLTPADIHNIAFKKPPIGKRGYDEEEVDAFLDEVEQELIRLREENGSLHGQIQHSGGGSPVGPNPSAALNAELAGVAAQLDRLQEARDRAEQNARSLQSQLEQARSAPPSSPMGGSGDDDRGARVLMMAQRTADDHLSDARRESEALLADARTKSDQLVSEAQLKAGTLEADARRNHTEAMNSLVDKRAAMIEEIGKLGNLAQSYQTALDSHLARQLQELDSVDKLPTGQDFG